MKRNFPGFYPLEEARLEELLDRATIVLDVDVLLDLFRLYPEDTRCFLSLLSDERIKQKLWMPYDVAWLYHKRVNEEIQKQIDNVNTVLLHLSLCGNAIRESKRFPYLENKLICALQSVTQRVEEACKATSDSLSESLKHSEIKDSLQSLFDGKIGEEYEPGELEKVYDSGLIRYRNNEPPGYESEATQENRIRYHDLIIWKQILAYARNIGNRCRGILFVTGKVRTDWYYVVNEKVVSTRHELINEFLREMNVSGNDTDKFFYCISSKQFVDMISSRYRMVHCQLVHLKEALQEEIVYSSLNADGMLNNQTGIQSGHE